MSARGLIVGKFYPPHRGHRHLIECAASQVERLSVIVCRKPGESPPGELRAEWLRELHPEAEILLLDDDDDEQETRVWAENSIRLLGRAPDLVFSSEDYGERFARSLGCRHVMVDRDRLAVPISGAEVRADPLANWQYLEPPVRAWYARRVCLAGAESTGKTTLARLLADHYRTVWAPEYGREYSERKLFSQAADEWREEEFIEIARRQCEIENRAARSANRVLICDTDAFATGIWHRRYFGRRSAEVEAIAAAHRRPDLYLLTDVDTPFVQDGTRDGETIREWMHETFVEELTAQGSEYRLLSGSLEERLERAIAYVDELIG